MSTSFLWQIVNEAHLRMSSLKFSLSTKSKELQSKTFNITVFSRLNAPSVYLKLNFRDLAFIWSRRLKENGRRKRKFWKLVFKGVYDVS